MRDDDLRRRLRQNSGRRPPARAPIRRDPIVARTPAFAPVQSEPTEPIKLNKTTRSKISAKVLLPIAAVLVLGIVGSGLFFWRTHSQPKQAAPVAHTVQGPAVKIPTYYPQNLPSGYTYNNDAKAVKPTIMYYSVTGPNNQRFYVSQQPIPPNFDFTAFNKKFLNPQNFSSDAGIGITGTAGADLIGSIQTNKNTWIIINSPAANSTTELETIARSLEPAK